MALHQMGQHLVPQQREDLNAVCGLTQAQKGRGLMALTEILGDGGAVARPAATADFLTASDS